MPPCDVRGVVSLGVAYLADRKPCPFQEWNLASQQLRNAFLIITINPKPQAAAETAKGNTMNATITLQIADVDTAFELIMLEELLAAPAMEANADTFAFAYRY